MGQKVHPNGFRLGVIRGWQSSWYAKKNYQDFLHEDLKIRKFIEKELAAAGISRVQIERKSNQVKVHIYTARPGIVIGKKGQEVDRLKARLAKRFAGRDISINIKEVRKPEADAYLVAENIAQQLERRVAFRRAMKKAISTAMRFGAKGIRVNCSGRLAGNEIARMEWYREGRVPLHTIRADIEYGLAEANTTFGVIGVKVWIFREEVLSRRDKRSAEEKMEQPAESSAPAQPAGNV